MLSASCLVNLSPLFLPSVSNIFPYNTGSGIPDASFSITSPSAFAVIAGTQQIHKMHDNSIHIFFAIKSPLIPSLQTGQS